MTTPKEKDGGLTVALSFLWSFLSCCQRPKGTSALTLSGAAPLTCSNGRGGAHCAPPRFPRVLGGYGSKFLL